MLVVLALRPSFSLEDSSNADPSPTLPPIPPRREGRWHNPDRDENKHFSELISMASCINSKFALPTITYVEVKKAGFDCEVGLSLVEKNGAAVFAEVSKSGLFAKTRIREGCEILVINGQCVHGPRSVMRIIKDIAGRFLFMC